MFRRLPSLLLLFVLGTPAAAWAEPPTGFAQRVEALRKSIGVPGASVAIVENGKTVMARGFGTTELKGGHPVDADTIFATGSTGKAVTVAALATLVDQGKIGWDDKVIDHMPEFRMWDAWVTREMTIRDLLVHRSGLGLGAGDLLFVPRSNLSRAEALKRIRYIKPATSFRSGYAYDNILYMAVGQLIEDVTGQTWEQYVRQNVFRKIGMNRSTTDNAGRVGDPNHAHPHARIDGPIRGLGTLVELDENRPLGAAAAPAGNLAISANDMTRWLKVQLARGEIPGGGRLFSEAASKEMWDPVVIEPNRQWTESLKLLRSNFTTYALGWEVQDYRGTKIVWHSGGVLGSVAVVVLIPERNIGFYIAVNSEDGDMRTGLMYELLDHYLGFPRENWPEKLHAYLTDRYQEGVKALQAPAAQPAKVGPSLPLARYAGKYSDPWFGTITIAEKNGALAVEFPHWPDLSATLEHWQYDTFKTRFSDPAMEPAYVTFGIDADGKVDRITMKPVSPVADFSYDYQDLDFTPAAASK